MHFITSDTANALILEAIKRTAAFACENESEFINRVHEASSLRQSESVKSGKAQILKNEKRIAELDALFRKTYEDFVAGRLNEKRFEQLSQVYEAEQVELEAQAAKLREEVAQFEANAFRADAFLELAKRYTDFSKLTPAMLHEFVEKVVVHEGDKSSGRRVQQVDIYLNYIGQFAVSDFAEQPQQEDPEKQKNREYQREYKRRKRAEQKAAEQKMTA